MFTLISNVRFKATKVVTDVAMRSGQSNSNSLAPFDGMNHVVNKYYKTNTKDGVELPANIMQFLECQDDFDADVIQPTVSSQEDEFDTYDEEDLDIAVYEEYASTEKVAPFNPSTNNYAANDYIRCLEDIPGWYVEQYLGWLLYRIMYQSNTNGMNAYKEKYRLQQAVVMDNEGTDIYTAPADLEVTGVVDANAIADIAEARERLPFVLKRLFYLSRLLEMHMPSYCVSYTRAKRLNESRIKAGATTAYFKHTAVYEFPVYSCKLDGSLNKRVYKENKHVKAEIAFNWCAGNYDKYNSYRQDFVDYIRYLDILNIDYESHFERLTVDFINSLKCDFIMSNTQYDSAIADALQNKTITHKATAPSVSDMLMKSRQYVELFSTTDSEERNRLYRLSTRGLSNIQQWIRDVVAIYYQRIGDTTFNASFLSFEDGMTYYAGSLLILDSQRFDGTLHDYPLCAITDTGLVFRITNRSVLSYCHISDIHNCYMTSANVISWKISTL